MKLEMEWGGKWRIRIPGFMRSEKQRCLMNACPHGAIKWIGAS